MKRKLMAIFAMVVILMSGFAMMGMTATAQVSTVPDISGTWTGYQDTYGLEQYTNKLTVTQNGNQVQGTYELVITQSIWPANVGQTGAYSVSGTIDENGNFNLVATLVSGPSNFSPTFSDTWVLSADGSTLSFTNPAVGGELTRVTKASVLADIATLRTKVSGLPNAAFIPGTKSAMLAIIDAATLQAKYGKYGAAAYTLQSKFIPRVDGCALRMMPDMLDLVRTCPAQAPLYKQANSLVQDLQWLQANPP